MIAKLLIRLRKRLSFKRRWVRRMETLSAINIGLTMAEPHLSEWGKRRRVRLALDFVRMANLRKSQVNTETER